MVARFFTLFALLIVFHCQSSHAIVFVEPLLGYVMGAYHAELEVSGSPVSLDSKISGLTYGGRAGLSLRGLQLGLDYAKNEFKVAEEEDFGVKKIMTDETALFLGYHFYFLRLYAGYIFDVKLKDTDFDSGKGFKAGLSFYVFKNLALSIEGRSINMDEFTDKFGDKVDGSYTNVAFLLSVPIEI